MIFTTQSESRAAGRCEQVRDRLAGDAQRLLQRLGLIHQHVGARGGVTLIVDQPLAPAGILGAGRQRRALAIRHRLGRIGDVLVVALAAGGGRFEAEPAAGQQEQRARFLRAAFAAGARPVIVLAPLVGAGLVDEHARRRRAAARPSDSDRGTAASPCGGTSRRCRLRTGSRRCRGLRAGPGRDSTARAPGAAARRADPSARAP